MSPAAVRQLEWIDAVAEALAALRRVMADDRADAKTQFAAAETILRLEMTRMRTGRPVSGTEDDPDFAETDGELLAAMLGTPPPRPRPPVGDGCPEPPVRGPAPSVAIPVPPEAGGREAELRGVRPRPEVGDEGASLTRYVTDGRFALDNGPAERATRPLAVGRKNWPFIGGEGGLATAAVLVSGCASAERHGLNPWSNLRDLFDRLPALSAGADLSDFLPDVWATTPFGR